MEQVDWKRYCHEATTKALLAAEPRARSAYLDLASFYRAQARRAQQRSRPAKSPPQDQSWSIDGFWA